MKLVLIFSLTLCGFFFCPETISAPDPSPQQLANWLKRFPEADTNKDGQLTAKEAVSYRKKILAKRGKSGSGKGRRGAPRTFQVNPGWSEERFPAHSVSYKSPEEILSIYTKIAGSPKKALSSFEKPDNGAIRIVGTGHSFMAPGYRTLPTICKAAGFEQPLYTHTGGGITGSTRYKWEQENGIFQFEGKAHPKLLSSIANAKWEAMMWGPYFNDRPEYYSCWIDFCLKYNPGMKFYLSDAWPQLYQLGKIPESEEVFTEELLDRIGTEKREMHSKLVDSLREKYPDKVFIMPTCDAMVHAAKHFLRGELPGIEGIHRAVGKAEDRALWRDPLGHLGPGLEWLEGYVFYSTIYGRSPELIEGRLALRGNSDFPGPELHQVFKKIAWDAVCGHRHSGVVDEDADGLAD